MKYSIPLLLFLALCLFPLFATAQSLTLTRITPEAAAPGTPFRLFGTGFDAAAGDNTVTFTPVDGGAGTTAPLTGAQPTALSGTVPAGLAGGLYTVSVTRASDGATASLPDLVAVVTGGGGRWVARDTLRDSAGSTLIPDGALASGDVDGDGDLDLLVNDSFDSIFSNVRVFTNDGAGGFTDTGASLFSESVDNMQAAFADVDSDGDLDLVVAAQTKFTDDGVAALFRNDGTGSFTEDPGAGLTGLSDPTLDAGDIDGDGDVDLVQSGRNASGTQQTILYRNDGSGAFAEIANSGLADASRGSSVFADVDGDGDLDLILTGVDLSNNPRTIFYRNDGTGVFTEVTGTDVPLPGGSDLDLADVDGDGDLDLAAAGNGGFFTGKLLINDGSGLFTEANAEIADVENGTADFADVDADGDPDLLITGNIAGAADSSITTLYRNDGSGSFAPANELLPRRENSSVNERSVAFGDMNGDGTLDLLLGGFLRTDGVTNGVPLQLFLNSRLRPAGPVPRIAAPGAAVALTGAGFDAPSVAQTVTLTPVDSSFFSTDVPADAVSAGRLTFTVPTGLAAGLYHVSVKRADEGALVPLPNLLQVVEGGGVFTDVGNRGMDGVVSGSALSGDIDGDGDLDYSTINTPYFLNDGSASFTASNDFATLGGGVLSKALADVNGDGRLDEAVNGFNFETTIFLNVRGDSLVPADSLVPLWTTPPGLQGGDAEFADVDTDSDPDLLITGEDAGGTPRSILLRNDDGRFVDAQAGLTGVQDSRAAFADIDGDGALDLILTGLDASNNGRTILYRNDGSGSFTEVTGTGLPDVNAGAPAFADVDGDGDPDLVLTGSDQATGKFITTLYFNDGAGNFTDAGAGLTGQFLSAATFADVDGDGDPDLLVTGREGNISAPVGLLYLNDGSGGFTDAGLRLKASDLFPGGGPDITFGDFDADGDADLILEEQEGGSREIVFYEAVTTAPATANTGLFGVENEPVVFKTSDFPFTDPDAGDTLAIVEITGLPGGGTLFLDSNANQQFDTGEEILSGDQIDAADINQGQLIFTPPADFAAFRAVSIGFRVGDGLGGFSGESDLYITLDEKQITLSETGTAGTGQWHLLTTATDGPLSPTPTTGLLGPLWTQGATGSDAPNAPDNIFSWNETQANWQPVADLTQPVTPGSGMAVFAFTDDDFSTSGIQGGWPKTLTAEGTHTTGPVQISGLTNTDANGNSTLDGLEGWNLVGNPYGTSISVDSLFALLDAAFTDVNINFSVWDQDNGWMNIPADGTGGAIAPFQSFFLRLMTPGETGNITLTDSVRTPGSTTVLKQRKDETPRLTLSLSGQGLQNRVELRTRAGASVGPDRYDGFWLAPLSDTFVDIHARVANNHFSEKTLPADLSGPVSLPLVAGVSQTGTYELKLSGTNIPSDWLVELADLNTGELLFSGSGDQSFNVDADLQATDDLRNEEPRFELTLTAGTATPIDETAPDLPQEFALSQNFPNPFNPSTTIEFALPQQAQINLKVYNIMGREVATLVNNETRPAGNYSVNFDASRLASGVYLYRLKAGPKVFTRKMILIK